MAITTKAGEGLPVRDPVRELEIERGYDRHAPEASAVARAILRWCRGEL